MDNSEYYLSDLAHKWIEQLHGKEFNSTSEEMCFQKYAYCDGYEKGFQDAIEKAKQIIISFMPLPSHKNHNINYDVELLEERQKYAKQVAERFEEKMIQKERGVIMLHNKKIEKMLSDDWEGDEEIFVPEEECSKPFNKPKILGCNEVLDSN